MRWRFGEASAGTRWSNRGRSRAPRSRCRRPRSSRRSPAPPPSGGRADPRALPARRMTTVPRSNCRPCRVNGLPATATFTPCWRSRANAFADAPPSHGSRNATLPSPVTEPGGTLPGLTGSMAEATRQRLQRLGGGSPEQRQRPGREVVDLVGQALAIAPLLLLLERLAHRGAALQQARAPDAPGAGRAARRSCRSGSPPCPRSPETSRSPVGPAARPVRPSAPRRPRQGACRRAPCRAAPR